MHTVKNKKSNTEELLILGVYLASSGYPNVKYRIEDLKKNYPLCREVNFPMWREQDLDDPKRHSTVVNIVRALYAHIFVISSLLFSRRPSVAYIPYPAIFICFFISFFPSLLKPKHLVIDMFISVYDSAVIDRKLFGSSHIIAKLLMWVEKRALGVVDIIITDTDLNSDYYAALFDVDRLKFEAIPLSTDETGLLITDKPTNVKKIEVVFVGTLVPLHGIKTIVDAIELLVLDDRIHFTIVGDGQDRSALDLYSKKNPDQVRWIKNWQNEMEIAKYISAADICLGIFGGGDKTQRVCPFKLYLYMSHGKSVITSDTKCMQAMFSDKSECPIHLVPSENPQKLAKAIQVLSDDQITRKRLEIISREFYWKFMANQLGMAKLFKKLNVM
ncbi:MAG: glycosyltransferase [Pseudomonadales bacterium]|nr:glycosyltransferase [Pseudomonadales bacterium]